MSSQHEKQIIDASLRSQQGPAFRSANQASVPGVVYGKKLKPISIAMDEQAIERVYKKLGNSTIFELNLPEQKATIPVLLHEVARHPNTNKLIHFDLYAVTLDQKIKTDISIHFEGEAPANSDSTLTVSYVTDSIEIEALPNDLPDQVVIDISDLVKVGDAKHVRDIHFDSGVTVLTDPDTALVKVDLAREEEEEAAPEEPAGDVESTDDSQPEETEEPTAS